jgi:hypothetical protein
MQLREVEFYPGKAVVFLEHLVAGFPFSSMPERRFTGAE